VDKESLELALCKVYDAHQQCKLLELRRRRRGAVNERTTEVDERVDEEGSEVFDDEDSSPGDLGT
jgi:hypothetical protein